MMEMKDQGGSPVQQRMEDEAPVVGGTSCMTCVLNPCVTFFCCPCVCCSSWVQVNQREVAVVQFWGRFAYTEEDPGLHWIHCCGRSVSKISTADISMDLPNQKMSDSNGNPLNVSGVIMFKVQNAYKATIDVANYLIFVREQAQVVLKTVVARHPYESHDGGTSLKTEGDAITQELVQELQRVVNRAGLHVLNFRINDLSYAPEIAAQMLKRQQAVAMVQARSTIVQGAVDTAMGAISALESRGLVISADGKEKLVINLLTVMTSEAAAQPTINVGGGQRF
jgi:regulator of protease activity HflC (stomatin/prohibitin superfamily)